VYTKLWKFEAVKGVLVKVFSNPASTLDWEHAAEGFHLLAQDYLELKQVKEAEVSCDEAMRARRLLFGKSSPFFIESLNLRIAICEAKGDTILAIGYRNMLEAGKAPTSNPPKASKESTSNLPMPQTVASPSTAKEDPE
jgi:hypothetical protein